MLSRNSNARYIKGAVGNRAIGSASRSSMALANLAFVRSPAFYSSSQH